MLVGNPDIGAPREDHLTLELGHYASELINELGLDSAFLGKPFCIIHDIAFSRLGAADPGHAAMVGDTLHTDMLSVAAFGTKTVLVTDHGLFAVCDHATVIAKSEIVPNHVIPTI